MDWSRTGEAVKRQRILGKAAGVYTNAIALLVTEQSFVRKFKDALTELGLLLIRLESAEPLKTRLAKYSIDTETDEFS